MPPSSIPSLSNSGLAALPWTMSHRSWPQKESVGSCNLKFGIHKQTPQPSPSNIIVRWHQKHIFHEVVGFRTYHVCGACAFEQRFRVVEKLTGGIPFDLEEQHTTGDNVQCVDCLLFMCWLTRRAFAKDRARTRNQSN